MEIGEPALVALRPASAIRSTPTVTIRIVDVKGLYEPGLDDRSSRPPGTTRGSSYAPGYTSADDRGRIFRNRSPDGTWASRTQYVELTVRVLPAGVPIPGGATIVWEVEEPGDHSADDPQMRTDAAGLFPNARNDPRGRARVRSRLEQIDPMFALSGNETTIDPATRESKVRLHVSDVAGDTYRVKASTRFAPCTSARTGVMTVWDRIELEYVKMASAIALPVNEIAAHYDIARVQAFVAAHAGAHPA